MGFFKSYDIRGVYGTDLDENTARKIGASLGRHFANFPEHKNKGPLNLVVGRDMRTSAPTMASSFIDGLQAAGHHVTDIGMVTTPCCYFAIQLLGADGGIMCTASHNPPQYIGFKVSREQAMPISYDTGLNDVEAHLDDPPPEVPPGNRSTADVDDKYVEFLVGMAHGLRPIKVAADASNGMAGKYLSRIFEKLPCELEGIFLDPDGTFPNHEADPLKIENLQEVIRLVKDTGAAVGLCFDGDADRVAIVDEKGEPIGCDLVTALLSTDTLKDQPGKPVTYDLRSSKVVKEVIAAHGGEPVRSRVGHSHVKRMMREIDAVSGGELSGHYYFALQDKVRYYADSALVAMVRLLNILCATDQPISEIIAPMKKYFHTGEINFSVDDKDAALAEIAKTFHDGEQDELDGVTVQYSDWWFNVRPSNTEPLLRLTLEGDTAALRDAGYENVLGVLNRFGKRVSSAH